MVVGKADPGTPAKKPQVPQSRPQTPRQAARTKQKFLREQWGGPPPGKGLGVRRARKAKPGGPPIAREDYPKIPSGPGFGQRPRPVGKAGGYDFPKGKPPARPKPKAGVGNLPPSGFPHRGAAHKAVQKAIKAVRGR